MDFINENENTFRTPNVNMKNKRLAFSSAKNKAKKVFTDVRNTIDSRQNEFEDVGLSAKAFPKDESLCREFKSPKRVTSESTDVPKTEVTSLDDLVNVNCRCSSDVNVMDDFWNLPEELSLTKSEIDLFATKWMNDFKISDENIYASSPVNFDTSIINSFVPASFKNSESFEDLLDESYEVVPLELSF